RMTTDGTVTNEFPITTFSTGPVALTRGPDNNLWFVLKGNLGSGFQNPSQIGRMTTSGVATLFDIPLHSPGADNDIQSIGKHLIATGSDDALWFTEDNANRIGRVSTDGQITELQVPTARAFPVGIIGGSDGNIWFTEFGPQANIGPHTENIGRVTVGPSGP